MIKKYKFISEESFTEFRNSQPNSYTNNHIANYITSDDKLKYDTPFLLEEDPNDFIYHIVNEQGIRPTKEVILYFYKREVDKYLEEVEELVEIGSKDQSGFASFNVYEDAEGFTFSAYNCTKAQITQLSKIMLND